MKKALMFLAWLLLGLLCAAIAAFMIYNLTRMP